MLRPASRRPPRHAVDRHSGVWSIRPREPQSCLHHKAQISLRARALRNFAPPTSNKLDGRYSVRKQQSICPSRQDIECRCVVVSFVFSVTFGIDILSPETNTRAHAAWPPYGNNHAAGPSHGAHAALGGHVLARVAGIGIGILRRTRSCSTVARIILSWTRHRTGVLWSDF